MTNTTTNMNAAELDKNDYARESLEKLLRGSGIPFPSFTKLETEIADLKADKAVYTEEDFIKEYVNMVFRGKLAVLFVTHENGGWLSEIHDRVADCSLYDTTESYYEAEENFRYWMDWRLENTESYEEREEIDAENDVIRDMFEFYYSILEECEHEAKRIYGEEE